MIAFGKYPTIDHCISEDDAHLITEKARYGTPVTEEFIPMFQEERVDGSEAFQHPVAIDPADRCALQGRPM